MSFFVKFAIQIDKGPAKVNLDETISTLRFACTAKRIKNKAKINEDAKDALLRKFQEQILELKRQLEEDGNDSSKANEAITLSIDKTTTVAESTETNLDYFQFV